MAPPWISSPDFATALHRAGLGRWADALVALDRPSVRLRAHGPTDDGDVAVGSSKLGGAPDLAPGAVWPTWKGAPLSFVAQISLAEMPVVPDQPLPAAGLLATILASPSCDRAPPTGACCSRSTPSGPPT
jgi:hypothetical protein